MSVAEVVRMPENPNAEFFPIFDQFPLGLALCQQQGIITAMNPALERMLGIEVGKSKALQFLDLLHAQDRSENERLIAELFQGSRTSFQIDSRTTGLNSRPVRWTAWKISAANGASDRVLAWQKTFREPQWLSSACGRPSAWKRSEDSPAVWRTTSIIF